QEAHERPPPGRFRQPVGTVFRQALGDLGGVEACLGIGVQPPHHVVRGDGMPRHRFVAGCGDRCRVDGAILPSNNADLSPGPNLSSSGAVPARSTAATAVAAPLAFTLVTTSSNASTEAAGRRETSSTGREAGDFVSDGSVRAF